MDKIKQLTTSTIWSIETALNFLREVPDNILIESVGEDKTRGFSLGVVIDKMDSFTSRCRILEIDD